MDLSSWLPMSPAMGPPLPAVFGIIWPWVKIPYETFPTTWALWVFPDGSLHWVKPVNAAAAWIAGAHPATYSELREGTFLEWVP